MSLKYVSTRNRDISATASEAILQGLASDGGLFVPTEIPRLDVSLDTLAGYSYQRVAFEVMKLFLTDFSDDELMSCINAAYDKKFDTPAIAPLKKEAGVYYLELFHGATIAFKDMALSILPHLMTTAAKKNNVKEEIVILTATSGDTGKAALAGFADVPGTRIVVFYPKDGVSPIQERQMVTQKGGNTRVIAIRGNFDQAQTGVKQIFGDDALKDELKSRGYILSSANSINIGRLVPQICYYVYAYTRLVAEKVITPGDTVDVTVPTGNFGNILACYYAKQMGLPIGKLVCASNENKVLYDFFGTGVYDKNREFVLTTSPSMDILISSNLERLIYHITGDDDKKTAKFMEQLSSTGKYEITEEMRSHLTDFYGGFANENATAEEISRVFHASGYVIDTHTAVASAVSLKYREGSSAKSPMIIASTASPYKFTRYVLEALAKSEDIGRLNDKSDLELTKKLESISGVAIPNAVLELFDAPVLHDIVCDVDGMPDEVKEFLN
ncbi:MAG: threonine synthase [Lachnospiraceae bacterium]|nr:threonine synthase [Lachnospiraceae bacterium]